MADHARLDELRRLFAEHPRRYFAPLASALRRAGEPATAVAVLRAHLADQPEHLTGHVILAQALADAGDLAGAEAAFERAHAVDAGNVVALGQLVELARGRGDRAAEAQWLARLAEADPEPEGARRGAGAPATAGAGDGEAGGFELLDFDEVPAPGVAAPVGVTSEDAAREAGGAVDAPPAGYDPVVGLDDAPADPLPAPIREALPALADEHELAAGDAREGSSGGSPDPASEAEAAPPAAPFVTETMANLLAAQGHTAQAIDVYARLLAQRPDDLRLRARLDALRADVPPAAVGAESADRDAWAAEMWRAALAPVPPDPSGGSASEPAAVLATTEGDPGAADAEVDDLSFDHFFEAFGDAPDPTPAEPAGDFERWAAEADRAGAPAAPGETAVAAAAPAGAAGHAPDDPDADLAAFTAWLRGVDA